MAGENNVEKVYEKFEEILQRMTRIETKLDNYNGLKQMVYETVNQCKNNSENIKQMQDQKKFISRTAIAALITTSISTVVLAIINLMCVKGG
jgi:hypothetical protein